MNTDKNTQTMVSRSLRIKPDTLTFLHKRAEEKGLGITVLIREILEDYVHSYSPPMEYSEMNFDA